MSRWSRFSVDYLLFSCVQDPRVLDAMLPYLVNYYGNPHSRTHAYGWESEAAMEHARQVSTNSEKFGSPVRWPVGGISRKWLYF